MLIKAKNYAALMKKANLIYMEKREELDQVITSQDFSGSYNNNPLNGLDQEFYDLYNGVENLRGLKVKYIRSHVDEFVSWSN